jgi:hypothetical protein
VSDREFVEQAHDPRAADREVGQERRAVAPAVIDNTPAAKAAAGPQGIARKVDRPALVAPLGHDQAQAFSLRWSAPMTTAQRQILRPVQAVGLLAVDHQALPAEQRMQSHLAEPPVLPGEVA